MQRVQIDGHQETPSLQLAELIIDHFRADRRKEAKTVSYS